MVELTQFVITGLTVGMVYSLVALGFVLVWKSSGVANLALGQLVLVSSWFTYSMLVQVGLPVWLGFPLVVLFALGMGWLIERAALRPLITQPILSLITVTLGVAFFIQGAVSFIWPKSVAALPSLFPQEPVHIGAAVVSQEYLWAAAISLVLFGALSLFFKYHKMGIVMRAVADDKMAVQACGIQVTRLFSLSWMFACVLAAIGGILMSSIGGLGAIIAGPIIGLAENLGGGYLTPLTWPGVKEVIPFVIIIIVMFIRPHGLFGERRIERI